MAGDVKLEEVSKSFGDFKAVDNVTLDIAGGSFVTLLGHLGSRQVDGSADDRRLRIT